MDILTIALLMLAVILIGVISFFITTLIHELGHVVVELLYGWKFAILVVGPIGLKRRNDDRLTLYLEKNKGFWGGIGGASPVKEATENNLKVFAKSLLGGPIASIAVGIIFLIVCCFRFSSGFHFSSLGLLLDVTLLMFTYMLLSIGIVCLVPIKNGFTYTDGKRWLRIRGEGQEKAEEIALFKMVERQIFKKSNDTLQKEDFEALLSAKHPVHRYYGYYYLYLFYRANYDDKNKIEILEILNTIKNNVPKFLADAFAHKLSIS